MQMKIFDSAAELDQYVAVEIKEVLEKKPDALLCFPSGNSPVGIYHELIRLNKEKKIDFSHAWFVGLDEWVAIGKNNLRSCVSFMKRELFSDINLKPSRICFFDGEATDTASECKRIDRLIKEHSHVDYMLLGVGMNGHLGLNEPGVNPDLFSHVINVSETTKEVAQKKYFDQPVNLEKGITLGIRQIKESKSIVVIMNGKHKSGIASRIMNGEISSEVPATLIRNLAQTAFYLDKEAAEKI